MSDTNCPYCDAEIEINHDDGHGYTEDEAHQQECPECEKNFIFYTSIHFSYDASKADCLNGGEHKWKKTLTIPAEYSKLRCEDCQEEKPWVKNNESSKNKVDEGK